MKPMPQCLVCNQYPCVCPRQEAAPMDRLYVCHRGLLRSRTAWHLVPKSQLKGGMALCGVTPGNLYGNGVWHWVNGRSATCADCKRLRERWLQQEGKSCD